MLSRLSTQYSRSLTERALKVIPNAKFVLAELEAEAHEQKLRKSLSLLQQQQYPFSGANTSHSLGHHLHLLSHSLPL
jgi:hypothetical protein